MTVKGLANALRETLRTYEYFDRVSQITDLMEKQRTQPSQALEDLIRRMRIAPVRLHNKVRVIGSRAEIVPYGGSDDLDANRYANWVSYNDLAARLRLAGYEARNTQRGSIIVSGRGVYPILDA